MILSNSIILYSIASAFYISALILAIFNLIASKKSQIVKKITTTIIGFGFIIQTIGLTVRWIESGYIEVATYEQTMQKLSGIEYWKVFTQHPPWSNLFEIMVYMSWGIIFTALVCEIKWRVEFLNIFSLILTLMVLGIAATNNKEIKPLVPALKSWWLMIHVISASVAYAAGTVGAITSLLFLLKTQNKKLFKQTCSNAMWFSGVIFILLGRGIDLFVTQIYSPNGENSPGAGVSLIVCITLCLISCIKTTKLTYLSALFSLFVFILLIIVNGNANIWHLAMFSILFLGLFFIGLFWLFPEKLNSIIPEENRLEHITYSNILTAFILVAVVLVTGALWAHNAWGRYWGWDPKETGALVIWITYALYLHTRTAYGWTGEKSAIIAIFAFFVMLAGFLGVNLGWFADGLHSYGQS